jgi:hypothetical protein
MPHIAKLTQSLDLLRTEIELNWHILSARNLAQQERKKLRLHTALCEAELTRLLDELDRMPSESLSAA